MANEEHLKILNQGMQVWNKWREEHPAVQVDLRYASLCEADLRGMDFGGSRLDTRDFSTANPIGADFWHANLAGADLSGAEFFNAGFGSANLSGAVLRNAGLIATRFRGTNLRGADLTGARVGYTVFARTDLREIKGLETVIHAGPSDVSVDTIYQSKGQIPEAFLKGTGAPESFIKYVRSLAGHPLYSCFISYSTKDQEFASRIYADLQDNGVLCWFAPHDVQAGQKLDKQIDIAIRMHEKVLLILSPNSINSEWVKTEIAKARKREVRERKRVLFPIRLKISFEKLQEWECIEADHGKDSAREIREYYIPDFSRWKEHGQYQAEFHKLLRDLKKENTIASSA